jgi:hypothetical protein
MVTMKRLHWGRKFEVAVGRAEREGLVHLQLQLSYTFSGTNLTENTRINKRNYYLITNCTKGTAVKALHKNYGRIPNVT